MCVCVCVCVCVNGGPQFSFIAILVCIFSSGLVGDTDWDQARGDMLGDYVDDMRKQLAPIRFEEDKEKQVIKRAAHKD